MTNETKKTTRTNGASPETEPNSLRRFGPWILAGLLVITFLLTALSTSQHKSETFDEPQHLLGGAVMWRLNDYRINPTNGNLPKRLVGLGLIMGGHAELPVLEGNEGWEQRDVQQLGHPFMYEANGDLPGMLWWGRAMIALSTAVICIAGFFIAYRLFGISGGLITLTAFAFSPTILAHGTLATSGMVVSGCFLAAIAAFWWCAHRLTPLTLVLTALTIGLLAVSKMSAALIGPMLILLGLLRVGVGRPWQIHFGSQHLEVSGRLKQAGLTLGILIFQFAAVVLLIWASFGFRYSPFNPDEGPVRVMYYQKELPPDSALTSALTFVNDNRLLPEGYAYGMGRVARNAQARASFLDGRWSIKGWWWFFPFSILVKTPLSILALWLLAIGAGVWSCFRRDVGDYKEKTEDENAYIKQVIKRAGVGLYRTAPLWLLIFVYGWFALRSNLNIGHRHILPSLVASLTLAGAAGYWFRSRFIILKGLVAVALIGLIIESALVYPHHLSFFNASVGGPSQGYRHMIDSSLDWGQELPGLKRHVEEHEELAGVPVYLSYFGSAIPEEWGIENRPLPSFFLRRDDPLKVPEAFEPGVYAISASMLQSVYLPIRGAWCPFYESHYQDKGSKLRELLKLQANDPEAFDALLNDRPRDIEVLFAQFEDLRFARLCAFLRETEPDDQIGYAINLYYLNDDALSAAQYGPPPPMKPDPQIEGMKM